MEGPKKKKIYYSLGTFALAVGAFLLIGPQKNDSTIVENNFKKDIIITSNKTPNTKKSVAENKITEKAIKREIASVRSDLKPLNKVTDDWEEKLISKLKQNLPDDTQLEILEKKPTIHKKHKNVLHAHKVKIKLKRADGLESSFTALVSSSSGNILQTWNRTHYEHKDRVFSKVEATRLIPTKDQDN